MQISLVVIARKGVLDEVPVSSWEGRRSPGISFWLFHITSPMEPFRLPPNKACYFPACSFRYQVYWLWPEGSALLSGIRRDGERGRWSPSCSCYLVDACILEAERSPYCFRRAGLVFEEYFHAGRGPLDLSVRRRPRSASINGVCRVDVIRLFCWRTRWSTSFVDKFLVDGADTFKGGPWEREFRESVNSQSVLVSSFVSSYRPPKTA